MQSARPNAPTIRGQDPDESLTLNDSYIQSRYEKLSPDNKRFKLLKELNPLRPKIEENVYNFQQLWLYTSFLSRNKALEDR